MPGSKIGIYLLLLASGVMLVMAFIPDVVMKEKKIVDG